MPKYKKKSYVKRARFLRNYWKLRKQQHLLQSEEPQPIPSSLLPEIHGLSSMEVNEDHMLKMPSALVVGESSAQGLTLQHSQVSKNMNPNDLRSSSPQVKRRRLLAAAGIAPESDNTGGQGDPAAKEGKEDESDTIIEAVSNNAPSQTDFTGWQPYKVCRSCFVSDCKMYSMVVHRKLANAYKLLTGLSVTKKSFYPPYVCAECATRLTNFARFRTRTLQCHATMDNIIKKNIHVSPESVKSTVRSRRIGTNLIRSYTRIDHYDLKIVHVEQETENVNSNIEVQKDVTDSDNNGNNAEVLPKMNESDTHNNSNDEMVETNDQDPLSDDNAFDNIKIEIKTEIDDVSDVSDVTDEPYFADVDESSFINRTLANDNVMDDIDENTNKTLKLHVCVTEDNVVIVAAPTD